LDYLDGANKIKGSTVQVDFFTWTNLDQNRSVLSILAVLYKGGTGEDAKKEIMS